MKSRLFQHVRYARTAISITIMFGILSAIVMIVQMNLLSKVVTQVFLDHKNLHDVFPLLLFLLAAIVVRASFLWGRERTAQQGAIRVKSILRRRVFAHLLNLGPAYAKGEQTGELVVTVSEGIERLDAYFSRYLPQVVLSVVVPLLVLIDIFPFDWASGVLLLVTAPIIPLLMILIGSHAEEHIQRQWGALSRMGAHFLDCVQGLTTLTLFGTSERERQRIIAISDHFREKTLKVLRVAFLSGMVLEFMTAFAIALVAVTLGIRLLDNGIHFEQAFLILLLAPEFYRPLRDLGTQRHAAMDGKSASARICEILDTPVPVRAPANCIDSLAQDVECTIEIKNVGFIYSGSEKPALQDINLSLKPQTCTALVGRSGAGKSTLVNLLMRFNEISSGEIQVNGLPLTGLPLELWREQVSLVPQRPYLFYGSVRENILLARPRASAEEVAEAARLAGAADFIAQLPHGYETLLGERGARLSAGQIQRIALARAFLKNAPLLILDEPTSNLDPRSELLIRQALKQLLVNRTVLVIAHRLNTIALADQIAVLEEGRLVEVGSSADLLLQHGSSYSQLMHVYTRKE
ncbi:MAG TPA: thiol reductant ABC exporter subunit CydD, partial [Ktedonobacteraceae bacterium]